MPVRIGFIDHCIDEFHANHFPKMIREADKAGEFQIALAWDRGPQPGKKTLDQWCAEFGVGKADSVEQLVEQCDAIVVLSPDNGEYHEELSQVALRSGKPVYIDKPFAMDLGSARRMQELAARHGTPMFSSSALRFDSGLVNAIKGPLAGKPINFVATRSLSTFPVYGIHHLEIVSLLLPGHPKRVLQSGNGLCSALTVDFGDGRRAICTTIPGHPWHVVAYHGQKTNERATLVLDHTQIADFFPRFIDELLKFFRTRQPPVSFQQTLGIAAVHEAAQKALATPDVWVDVPGL